jgi:predicted dehydrogenase
MDSVRIGVVGLGGICRQRHLPGLQRIPGVEVVAVANQTRESSVAAAAEFGIPEVCDGWRALVAREDLDAVLVGTWPYLHRDISIAALEHGKHVFCQARMAMDLSQAEDMCEAARASGLVAMLCPVPFGLSVDATVRRLLCERKLGDVHLVRVLSQMGAWVDPAAPMTWRKDHRLSGLNMQTLGMYAEVMHRWFGSTQQVSALAQTFTAQRHDGGGTVTPVRIPDQVEVTAVMDGGVMVQSAFTGMSARTHESIDILGTRATLYYDVSADVLYWVEKDGLRPVEILPEDAYDVQQWRVEEDFVRAIREGTPYYPSFEDGLAYMKVVQGVADSVEADGRLVEL